MLEVNSINQLMDTTINHIIEWLSEYEREISEYINDIIKKRLIPSFYLFYFYQNILKSSINLVLT